MSKNIRDQILDAINTDDSFGENNSKAIIKTYTEACSTEKEKIDKIFINLCGFSFETLSSSLYSNNEACNNLVIKPTANNDEFASRINTRMNS